MGRFATTGQVEVKNLEHSVLTLQWSLLHGALGPSDGSIGAMANVPSALSVLRHAELYDGLPAEIDEAFAVLERHAIRHRVLYPVALAILPFLFDVMRRGSPLAARIADVIAEYAAVAGTLEPRQQDQLNQIIVDHGPEIMGWIGREDRGVAALAIHVPALRADYLATIERRLTTPGAADASDAPIGPVVLLALAELELDAPLRLASIRIAMPLLDRQDGSPLVRMAAAVFLARAGADTPDLRTRIDAALPLTAPAALRALVGDLWIPTITRPVVAPRLHEAEVVFVGEKLVLVRAGAQSITLPWVNAQVQRGDRVKVGITAHGQAKLAVVTEHDGAVRVIDF